jgi:capsular exopolysaccharide synthesis family protein
MITQPSPILEEIRRLCEDRETGVLQLVNQLGERVSMSFCEGMIDAVSSNQGSRRVSDYLIKGGFATADELDAIKPGGKDRKTFIGELIVRNKIVGQAEVGVAVRRQSLDLIEHVLGDGFKVSSFTNSLRSYHVPAKVSFFHVMHELSRHNPEIFEVDPHIQIRLTPEADASKFLWNPQELCVLKELQAPRSFEKLRMATGLQEPTLKRILAVLERIGVIQTVAPDFSKPDETTALATRMDFALETLIPRVTNAVLHEKLEVAKNDYSFTAEQFRNLKIQIRQAESDTPRKVFTISSPDAQDGKSLIATNLAFSFAQDPGCRVLIVDCDLRKPSLDQYLGVTTDPGLMQYLSSGPLGPHCFIRRLDDLYFMTAGGIAPNPIEALSMRKMKLLVEQLRSMFDVIILDAPPYSPIADARVVTALSDGLILVIRSGKTGYSSADRAFQSIDQRKLLGVVLNDVKAMPMQTYHSYNYYGYDENRKGYVGNGKRLDSGNYLEP